MQQRTRETLGWANDDQGQSGTKIDGATSLNGPWLWRGGATA